MRIHGSIDHIHHSPTCTQQNEAQLLINAKAVPSCNSRSSCIHHLKDTQNQSHCEYDHTKQPYTKNSATIVRMNCHDISDTKEKTRSTSAPARHRHIHTGCDDYHYERDRMKTPDEPQYLHHHHNDTNPNLPHQQHQYCHEHDQHEGLHSQQHDQDCRYRDPIDIDSRRLHASKKSKRASTVPSSPTLVIERIFCDTDAAIVVHSNAPNTAAMKHHMIMVRRFGMFCEICRSQDMEELGYIPRATSNLYMDPGRKSEWCSLCGTRHVGIEDLVRRTTMDEHARKSNARYRSATCEDEHLE